MCSYGIRFHDELFKTWLVSIFWHVVQCYYNNVVFMLLSYFVKERKFPCDIKKTLIRFGSSSTRLTWII